MEKVIGVFHDSMEQYMMYGKAMCVPFYKNTA